MAETPVNNWFCRSLRDPVFHTGHWAHRVFHLGRLLSPLPTASAIYVCCQVWEVLMEKFLAVTCGYCGHGDYLALCYIFPKVSEGQHTTRVGIGGSKRRKKNSRDRCWLNRGIFALVFICLSRADRQTKGEAKPLQNLGDYWRLAGVGKVPLQAALSEPSAGRDFDYTSTRAQDWEEADNSAHTIEVPLYLSLQNAICRIEA